MEYNTASAVTSTCTQEKKREQDLHAFGRGVKRRRAQRKQDLVLSPQKIKRVTKKTNVASKMKWGGEEKIKNTEKSITQGNDTTGAAE